MSDPLIRVLRLLPLLSPDELKLVAIRTGKLRVLGHENATKKGAKQGQFDDRDSSSSSSTTPNGHLVSASVSPLEDSKAVLQFLNEKTGAKFRAAESHFRLLQGLFNAGFTADQIRGVVAFKHREWAGTDYAKFLRPSTLFRLSNFENYYGQIGAKK